LEDVDHDRKVEILEKLRVKITVAREDGILVLYVSILGSAGERLEMVDDTSSNFETITHNYKNVTTAIVFRLVLG